MTLTTCILTWLPLPSAFPSAKSKLYARDADAGGSNGGAELWDNVADGDGGQRGGIGFVIGLHRVVRSGPGPQLVQAIYPSLNKIREREGWSKTASSCEAVSVGRPVGSKAVDTRYHSMANPPC